MRLTMNGVEKVEIISSPCIVAAGLPLCISKKRYRTSFCWIWTGPSRPFR